MTIICKCNHKLVLHKPIFVKHDKWNIGLARFRCEKCECDMSPYMIIKEQYPQL